MELGVELDMVVFLVAFVGSLFEGFVVAPKLFELDVVDVVRVVVLIFGPHLLEPLPAGDLRDEEVRDEEVRGEEPLHSLDLSLDTGRLALIKLTRRQEKNTRARSSLSLIFSQTGPLPN